MWLSLLCAALCLAGVLAAPKPLTLQYKFNTNWYARMLVLWC